MNILLRQILKVGLENAANQSIHQHPQVVCFAHDAISRKIMIDGIFEKKELTALKAFLLSNTDSRKICLDIGGNIGNHALYFSDLFEQVITFEPNRTTFQLLALNAKLASNITPVNIGIGDQEITLPAKVDSLNIGGARVSEEDDANIEFSLVALDDYLIENPVLSIDFIKMDVEGYELKALKGAAETLKKHQPILALELHVKKNAAEAKQILELLIDQGYEYAYLLRPRLFSKIKAAFVKVPLREFVTYSPKNHKMVVFTVN